MSANKVLQQSYTKILIVIIFLHLSHFNSNQSIG